MRDRTGVLSSTGSTSASPSSAGVLRRSLTIPNRRAPGDSDPHADELLHRARHPRGNWEICPECSGNLTPGHVCPPKSALYRLEVEAAYLERDRQIDAATAHEIAGAVA